MFIIGLVLNISVKYASYQSKKLKGKCKTTQPLFKSVHSANITCSNKFTLRTKSASGKSDLRVLYFSVRNIYSIFLS